MSSQYFSVDEVKCPCAECAKRPQPIVPCAQIMAVADFVRNGTGPLRATSGARCAAHNAAIGGAPESRHVALDAIDLECKNSETRFLIVARAILVGARCVEIAPDHIHLDMRPVGPRLIIMGGDH